MKKLWFGLLPLLFLSSCGHRREYHREHQEHQRALLSRKRIAAIKVGSKKEDVLALLGKPSKRFYRDDEGTRIDVLEFEQRKIPTQNILLGGAIGLILPFGGYALAGLPLALLGGFASIWLVTPVVIQQVFNYRFEFVNDLLVRKSKERGKIIH